MPTNRRLFVCVKQKTEVGDDIARALRKELKKQGLRVLVTDGVRQHVRVQTCSCLDLCEHCKKGPGAALIVYPEAVAYGNVRPADAAELVARHLGEGKVLRRLLLK